MGSPLLLLRLEGVLQSWGVRSRWDVRDTGAEPSKSGVLGLLGCALGWPAADERLVALDEQLIMAVRVEHEGIPLTDFQTVSGVMHTAEGGRKGSPDDPSTIVSPRAYLQDAAFLVALAGQDEVLQRCAAALRAPRWPVFLGRKSCPPTVPVLPQVTSEYVDLEDALRRHPWSWSGWRGGPVPERLRVVVERPDGLLLRPDRIRINPARIYANRAVQVEYVDFPGWEEVGDPCTSPG